MDKRISELRERLYKKKAEARQKENLPVRRRPHNSQLIRLLLNYFLSNYDKNGWYEIKCKRKPQET